MTPRAKGTETRGAWIGWTPKGRARICFRWPARRGKLYRITLDYTADDMAELVRIRDLVGAEIRNGIFVPEKRFPSVFGPRVVIEPAGSRGGPTLADDMVAWIEERTKRKVRGSRIREYESHRRNYIAAAPIGSIETKRLGLADFQAFQLWLVSEAGERGKGVHEKTASNVVRGTLQAFIRDRGTPEQTVALRSLRWERYRPGRQQDPFTAVERDGLLGWFRTHRPLDEYASIALRFQGITPSEVRALRVGDFERASSSIRIEQSEDRGEIAATKAQNRIRNIDLPEALGSVLATLCGLRAPGERLIRGIRTERALVHQWKRAQTALGYRFRSIYQAKHTFACLALIGGATLEEASRHLGVDPQTVWKHYAAAVREGRRIRDKATKTPRSDAL